MRSRLRLWSGAVLMCLLDAGLTLAGQSDAYWAGDRLAFREANPVAAWLLRTHPAAFAVGAVLLALGYVVLVEWLPLRLARPAASLTLLLHALGASTWLIRYGPQGIVAAAALLAAASWLLRWLWRDRRG